MWKVGVAGVVVWLCDLCDLCGLFGCVAVLSKWPVGLVRPE